MREICFTSSYIFSLTSIVFLQIAPILCYNYSPLSVPSSVRTVTKKAGSTGWHQCSAAGFDSFCHHTHFGFLLFQSPSVDFTASSLFHFLCYSVVRPHTSPQQTSSAEFTVGYKIALWTDYSSSSTVLMGVITTESHLHTSIQAPNLSQVFLSFFRKKWPWHINIHFPTEVCSLKVKKLVPAHQCRVCWTNAQSGELRRAGHCQHSPGLVSSLRNIHWQCQAAVPNTTNLPKLQIL